MPRRTDHTCRRSSVSGFRSSDGRQRGRRTAAPTTSRRSRNLVVDETAVEPDLLHTLEDEIGGDPESSSATRPTSHHRTRARAQRGKRRANSACRVTKNTITSTRPRAWWRTCTPSGSSPSVVSKPAGADTTATRPPTLIPSFPGNGVPEYPLVVAHPARPLALAPCPGVTSPRSGTACQPPHLRADRHAAHFLTFSLAFRNVAGYSAKRHTWTR